jgi:hypothetical protein
MDNTPSYEAIGSSVETSYENQCEHLGCSNSPPISIEKNTYLKSIELILQDSASPLDWNAASLDASLNVVLIFAETFIAALVVIFLDRTTDD